MPFPASSSPSTSRLETSTQKIQKLFTGNLPRKVHQKHTRQRHVGLFSPPRCATVSSNRFRYCPSIWQLQQLLVTGPHCEKCRLLTSCLKTSSIWDRVFMLYAPLGSRFSTRGAILERRSCSAELPSTRMTDSIALRTLGWRSVPSHGSHFVFEGAEVSEGDWAIHAVDAQRSWSTSEVGI
jgi:hypothetical protein